MKNFKKTILFLAKLFIGALGFFGGMILGSVLAGFMGLPVPPLPEGADGATLMQYQLMVSVIFAGTLAFISGNLSGRFITRFLILSWLSWFTFSINTYLEARLFTTSGAASIFTLVMQFMAVVLCSALMAWLFPPAGINKTAARQQLRAFVLQYRLSQWVWRLVLVWLAFPVCYVLFGRLAQPFIISFYEQHLAGLTAPGSGRDPSGFIPPQFYFLTGLCAHSHLLAAIQAASVLHIRKRFVHSGRWLIYVAVLLVSADHAHRAQHRDPGRFIHVCRGSCVLVAAKG